MTARKHLVKMLEQLINENEDEARVAFHEFVVSSARKIHESVLAEDDLDNDIDDNDEEYYGHDDMLDNDIEDDKAEDDLEKSNDMDMEDDMEDDMDMDSAAADDEVGIAKDEIVDALDAMEELTAKFEALLGHTENVDNDIEDVMADNDDIEDDMADNDMDMDDDMEDDDDMESHDNMDMDDDMEDDDDLEESVSHSGGVVSAKYGVDSYGRHNSTKYDIRDNKDAKLPESVDNAFDFDLTEEDFMDLEEGLKTIEVKMGGEQGGAKFAGDETNTKSPVATRDMSDVKAGSDDLVSKNADHNGYGREVAPSDYLSRTGKIKQSRHGGDNSRNHATDGLNAIPGQGGPENDKGRPNSEVGVGKFAGTETNVKSPIGSSGTRNGR